MELKAIRKDIDDIKRNKYDGELKENFINEITQIEKEKGKKFLSIESIQKHLESL